MTVPSSILIYFSNFPWERPFLFHSSNLSQNYWARPFTAFLCLRSCATRKRVNGLCSSFCAEKPHLAQSTLCLEQGAAQSCPATYFSFSPLPTRRGEKEQQSGALSLLSLPVSWRKTNKLGTTMEYLRQLFQRNTLSGLDKNSVYTPFFKIKITSSLAGLDELGRFIWRQRDGFGGLEQVQNCTHLYCTARWGWSLNWRESFF